MKADYIKIKALEVPLYRGKFIIVLTNSTTELKKHLPEFERPLVYAHSWAENYKGHIGYYMILNFENKHRHITHGCITHEALHIANFIASDRGIQASFSNDEPITYLAEWITDETYKFIKANNLKPEFK